MITWKIVKSKVWLSSTSAIFAYMNSSRVLLQSLIYSLFKVSEAFFCRGKSILLVLVVLLTCLKTILAV